MDDNADLIQVFEVLDPDSRTGLDFSGVSSDKKQWLLVRILTCQLLPSDFHLFWSVAKPTAVQNSQPPGSVWESQSSRLYVGNPKYVMGL